MGALSKLRRALRRPEATDAADPIDHDLVDRLVPVADRICRAYFRLEVEGMHRVPDGSALVVGNHNSGITFLEPFGVCARYFREHPDEPIWRGLAHDAMIDMPMVGGLLTRLGAVRAGHESADRVFAAGLKVMVFPGGNLEAFRPWTERNRVVFSDRKGFVKLAIRNQVPIVPMVFHGGHSGLIVLREGKRIARAIGAKSILRSDTWPLFVGLPWGVALGPVFHLPLPVKCRTVFLEPIDTTRFTVDQASDPEVLQQVYDEVVQAMQDAMDALAAR